MSRARTLVVRIGVALAATAILVYALDTDEILAALSRLSPMVAFVAAFMIFVGIALSAVRWDFLLRRLGVVLSRRSVLRMTFVGMLSSLGLPSAHGGDVVRGIMLYSTKRARFDLVVSSLLADRVYGVISIGVVALPGAAALFLQSGGTGAGWGLITVSVVALLLVPLLPWLFLAAVSVSDWMVLRIFRNRGARIAGSIRDTLAGLRGCFESRRTVAPSLLISIVVHVLAIVAALALGASMSIQISSLAYFAIVPAVWIMTMLPISIGGLGVREASFALLFAVFGAEPEEGMALGAAVSAAGILGILMGGAVLLVLPGDPKPAA